MEVLGKHVLVIGLGSSGEAAARLLQSKGAHVVVTDDSAGLQQKVRAARLNELGVQVRLGEPFTDAEKFDLAVISPGVSLHTNVGIQLRAAGVQIIGELELGYRFSRCLNVAITGTNGKTTTTELIAAMMSGAQRRTVAAGNIGLPFC
ncbi:MAG: UDP-N-acetylmuramoyl-L-alanine--D-glutamate ligase, partial [Pedosphaera sp.]|nr:UDP-N-acetylmuramoyl-L-alanine--D-glutamate ligase [Pedosphaera sp.]